jgi:hypothetical protein
MHLFVERLKVVLGLYQCVIDHPRVQLLSQQAYRKLNKHVDLSLQNRLGRFVPEFLRLNIALLLGQPNLIDNFFVKVALSVTNRIAHAFLGKFLSNTVPTIPVNVVVV